jgi:hypothetical protein
MDLSLSSCRLVQVMCCDSLKCKASLQEASVTVMLLHALRSIDIQSGCRPLQKSADSYENQSSGKFDAPCEHGTGCTSKRCEQARGLPQLSYPKSTPIGTPMTCLVGATFLAAVPLINRSTPYSTFQSFKCVKGACDYISSKCVGKCRAFP